MSDHRHIYLTTRTRTRDVSLHFPGGEVTVTRTSDGDYWAHISVDRPFDGTRSVVCDGRVDYTRESDPAVSNRPQSIPQVGGVEHIALRIATERVRS